MKNVWSVVFCFVFTCIILTSFAQASDYDQQTKVTFSQPVEIPGRVLPAGTYWFILAGTAERNVVQIFSRDWKTLYATEYTVGTDRMEPASETTFTFAERKSSSPEAVLRWFYPGETIGHEFLYPKPESRELARDMHQEVPAAPMQGF